MYCTTVEAASAAAYCAATVEVADWAAAYFTSAESWTPTETGASTKARPSAEARASAETAAEAMEPGTGTDEDAAGEPARAVVAVRGACVRVIIVVAVSANRRTGENWGADAHADYYSLCRSQ